MENLRSYFLQFPHHKKSSDPAIGVEYEFSLIQKQGSGVLPVPLEGEHSLYQIIEDLGKELAKSGTAYQQIIENERVIGLKGKHGNITIEPGGQLEFSSMPVSFQDFSNQDTKYFLKALHQTLLQHDAMILTDGVHPIFSLEQIQLVHKKRYHIMFPHMKKVGTRGQYMMKLTSSIQSSLDYFSQEELEQHFVFCNRLSPFLACLFANSPFFAGKPSGQKSFRYYIWRDTDNSRAGIPQQFLHESFQLNDYIKWALNASPYFLNIDGQVTELCDTPFVDLLQNPSLEKNLLPLWEEHLAMLFPEVRLKTFIEFRSFDAVPLEFIDAPPVILGLLNYETRAFEKVWALLMELNATDYETICHAVAKDGMNSEFRGVHLGRIARQIYEIVLEYAPEHHARLLIPYFEKYTKDLRSLADEALETYSTHQENIESYVAQSLKHNQTFLQKFISS